MTNLSLTYEEWQHLEDALYFRARDFKKRAKTKDGKDWSDRYNEKGKEILQKLSVLKEKPQMPF